MCVILRDTDYFFTRNFANFLCLIYFCWSETTISYIAAHFSTHSKIICMRMGRAHVNALSLYTKIYDDNDGVRFTFKYRESFIYFINSKNRIYYYSSCNRQVSLIFGEIFCYILRNCCQHILNALDEILYFIFIGRRKWISPRNWPYFFVNWLQANVATRWPPTILLYGRTVKIQVVHVEITFVLKWSVSSTVKIIRFPIVTDSTIIGFMNRVWFGRPCGLTHLFPTFVSLSSQLCFKNVSNK